jgi:hypothetical protein
MRGDEQERVTDEQERMSDVTKEDGKTGGRLRAEAIEPCTRKCT